MGRVLKQRIRLAIRRKQVHIVHALLSNELQFM